MCFNIYRKSLSNNPNGTDNDTLVIDSEDIIESSDDEASSNRRTSIYPDLSGKTDIRFHLSKSKPKYHCLNKYIYCYYFILTYKFPFCFIIKFLKIYLLFLSDSGI